MEWVETALGGVPVRGSFGTARPLVIAIRGAFPEGAHLADLAPLGCDLALLHLPGFFSPALGETSIASFVAAFDEVIQTLFAGREITALGVSTGALVALGLRSPEVRRVLAVEPFFSTAKLWPLIEFLRHGLAGRPPKMIAWIEAIFGVTAEGLVDRNYEFVLDRRDRPASALVGDVPLYPRRPIWGLPSLTDEEDRGRLPHRVVSGGHNLSTAEIRRALALIANEEGEHKPAAAHRRVAR